jgi:hypothetical protein
MSPAAGAVTVPPSLTAREAIFRWTGPGWG